ncbi:FtsK/SpoIIIE domain-containing protein [Mycobacterium xenopi]|uniref:FtsK/SpoIIIE domain-containing protein n=1 Tax=Mycobacterium xenopi TaxID=1789 RepID=UPI000A15C542|nr:FtsK/SpoIIIE domain-containing protein [Mycobacterium xenopi]ORX14137.1 cell division protein FtsK [Mycobacterium xenopi]SPX94859.1 cell division protein FtsK [Mycobacterium xenopi]
MATTTRTASGGAKSGETKAPPAAGSTRAYATSSAELNRPYVPGETAAEQKQAADDWRWIILAGLGLAALFAYTKGWPAARRLLYSPSPARDYLLPPSPHPLYVIAGVGVGWFWILFIATPLVAAAAAGLWWAMLAWSNHRARTGHLGHLRAGQPWTGEQYPAVPLILAGGALTLELAGALLRWAGPAAAILPGRLLLVGLLLAAGFGFAQFARWAYARHTITRQVNKVTFLASPALGWTDLRAGRVRVMRCCYPRRGKAFPKVVKLLYSQHPRSVGDELVNEVTAILREVTGRTYSLEHDALTRALIATETVIIEETDSAADVESVLTPLVTSWFDAGAHIASVTVDTPVPQHRTPDGEGTRKPQADEVDEELAQRSAATGNDAIAAAIREFTVGFAYNLKVSSAYRRGVIETMVSDALGGSWEAEWSMASRRVRFVRSPGLPTMVDPPLQFPVVTRAAIRTLYTHTVIPFGVDAYGNTISWDFKQSPHMLIAGQPSSGKTSLLMTVATQCARRGFNVVEIDPKGFDSPGMRDWPNVSLVTAGTDEDGLVGHTAALRFIADTMRERLSQVKINPNRADDFDPIIVITDEFSNLVVALAEFYATYKTSKEKGAPPTTKDVGILLRTARAVAIHMAIGIQRPDTMFISGEARDNTALRVAMGRLRSKDAAIMMFNDPVAGTRVQPGIKGRGTVQLPDGSFREMQAFYTPKIPATAQQWAALSDHERAILAELRNVDSFWPRRVVDSALRGYDPDDPEQSMSFAQIRQSPIVLACDRPDLDPLSDQYVAPTTALRQATMDDAHDGVDNPQWSAQQPPGAVAAAASFGAPVDGFDDDYLPTIDDEYSTPIAVAANEVAHGDLVDVSVDGVSDWKYVFAEPYLTEDADGVERLVIPYRDIDDGHNAADIEVDPYEVMQARKLHMH